MSPIEQAIVRRKLARIVDCLKSLSVYGGSKPKAWPGDALSHAAAERWLQLCIDAAIDLNAHLLVGQGHPAPTDGYASFLDLAKRTGWIPHDLAQEMAPSAGLRNHLIHRYDDLDDSLVLKGILSALRLYPKYLAELARRLGP